MDTRSKRIVDLLNKLQESIGHGDLCGPYSVAPGAEPDIVLTLEAKATGQVIRFHLWRAEIEQWRDIDPITKAPAPGPAHLKIIGDLAKSEQVSPPRDVVPPPVEQKDT